MESLLISALLVSLAFILARAAMRGDWPIAAASHDKGSNFFWQMHEEAMANHRRMHDEMMDDSERREREHLDQVHRDLFGP